MRITGALLVLALSASARTYRFDCATLAEVSARTFAPGDEILLKRGMRCSGALSPKGSGEPGRPIRLGAYGEGPLPVIVAGKAEAALKLVDQHDWEIENLEMSGGEPFGISITATAPRRRFVLRNLVVHDVSGAAQKKASGLIVLKGPLEDVLIDGVTAFQTAQWAGIYVSGSAASPARDVTVRNSIVHDVDGDGIVLFLTENGRIERTAAWRTGLQEREKIGTPNAIWTWRCRGCVVENTEGFWIDSPGVDGGVYDIDWGNEDNIVQRNYAHDAMGYCAAIFGSGKLATSNAVIRENVCVNNGRSPKLARRQGDIYTSTWGGGWLDGVRIERNTIVWNPPVDAPAIQMGGTEFRGARPNVVTGNTIYSAVSAMVRSAPPVRFEHNVYWNPGGIARWWYGGREYTTLERWREIASQDLMQSFELFPCPLAPNPIGPLPRLPRTGKFALVLLAGNATAEARSQLVSVQAALAQYPTLDAYLAVEGDGNLAHDWNLGAVHRIESPRQGGSVLALISPEGAVLGSWGASSPPAGLGLALKRHLGPAPSNAALPEGVSPR